MGWVAIPFVTSRCSVAAHGRPLQAQRSIEATATQELLSARCDPELASGFARIVAFKKKACAKAKLRGQKCDYADRWRARSMDQ